MNVVARITCSFVTSASPAIPPTSGERVMIPSAQGATVNDRPNVLSTTTG